MRHQHRLPREEYSTDVPGGVQEPRRCGTEGDGLVGSVGGRWTVGLDGLRGLFQL